MEVIFDIDVSNKHQIQGKILEILGKTDGGLEFLLLF